MIFIQEQIKQASGTEGRVPNRHVHTWTVERRQIGHGGLHEVDKWYWDNRLSMWKNLKSDLNLTFLPQTSSGRNKDLNMKGKCIKVFRRQIGEYLYGILWVKEGFLSQNMKT